MTPMRDDAARQILGDCRHCEGAGSIDGRDCDVCDGTGNEIDVDCCAEAILATPDHDALAGRWPTREAVIKGGMT